MREEFYFTQTLTECEHSIVEYEIRKWAVAHGLEVVYYRKFKLLHIPMQRECKVRGSQETINRFKAWAVALECPLVFENYWRSEKWREERGWWERTGFLPAGMPEAP